VTVADYVFIESEADGMRYEVHCRRCGERHQERSVPWAPPPRAGSEGEIQWPPDREPTPPRDWRTDVIRRVTVSAQRGKAGFDLLRYHTRTTYERARNELRTRRAGGEEEAQTGG
jgi:hypothetical protein